MAERHLHILKVIKRIRDSFHESVAVYTQGRCYQFAKILQEMFGGEIYQNSHKGHVMLKIDGKFYDIFGDCRQREDEEFAELSHIKVTEEEEISRWDGNYHSAPVSVFQDKYNS